MATKKVKRYDGEDGSLTSSDASNNADSIRAAQEEIYIPDSSTKTPAQPTQRRTPMVTKEQLDASGLSLRDYMNKQLGLTRRDGSSSAATPRKVGNAPGGSSTPSAVLKPNRTGQPGGSVPTRGAGTVMQQGRDTDLYGGSINDIKNLFKKDPSKKSFQEANDERIAKNYKKGGSVSSASSRGDGIAQRGKTRGKIC